jgi:hypothetical protein
VGGGGGSGRRPACGEQLFTCSSSSSNSPPVIGSSRSIVQVQKAAFPWWPVTARAQRISVQGALLALVCHILTNRPYGTAPVVSELVLW